MHHYITPRKGSIRLLKTELPIPEGLEYEYEGDRLRCIHIELTDGTYGYLLAAGEVFNRQHAIGQIRSVHPNPLVIDFE